MQGLNSGGLRSADVVLKLDGSSDVARQILLGRPGSSSAKCSIRSPRPSATASSLCWRACSLRLWVFCKSATSRKVMIVVGVLMISW